MAVIYPKTWSIPAASYDKQTWTNKQGPPVLMYKQRIHASMCCIAIAGCNNMGTHADEHIIHTLAKVVADLKRIEIKSPKYMNMYKVHTHTHTHKYTHTHTRARARARAKIATSNQLKAASESTRYDLSSSYCPRVRMWSEDSSITPKLYSLNSCIQ